MTRTLSLSILLFLAATFSLHAQEVTCNPPTDVEGDFCFTNPDAEALCAWFALDHDQYYLCFKNEKKEKKKYLALNFPGEEQSEIEYFTAMEDENRKQIGVEEVLFLQSALETWNTEQVKIRIKKMGFESTESGLQYKLTKEGTGKIPEKGKTVKVHYKGYLEDGTVFDSSFERGDPISFPLGVGRVIKGWDEGIAMFPVGSTATLRIPPELGYGARGAGGVIPPNATLMFDIEIVDAQ